MQWLKAAVIFAVVLIAVVLIAVVDISVVLIAIVLIAAVLIATVVIAEVMITHCCLARYCTAHCCIETVRRNEFNWGQAILAPKYFHDVTFIWSPKFYRFIVGSTKIIKTPARFFSMKYFELILLIIGH